MQPVVLTCPHFTAMLRQLWLAGLLMVAVSATFLDLDIGGQMKEAERALPALVDQYIEAEEERLNELQSLADKYRAQLRTTPLEDVSLTPPQLFLLVKYIYTNNQQLQELMAAQNQADLLHRLATRRDELDVVFPETETVQHAAGLLFYEQDTLSANCESIIKRRLPELTGDGPQMTAADALGLASAAVSSDDLYHTALWAHAILENFDSLSTEQRIRALEHLTYALGESGYYKQALKYTNEILQKDNDNKRALMNKEYFEREIKSEGDECEEGSCTKEKTTMDEILADMRNLQMDKSTYSKDPIVKYCAETTCNLPAHVQQLSRETLKSPRHEMGGAPEVLQMNINLLRLIKAKNALDIGTFTGLSALASASAISEDGRVISMDVTAEHRTPNIQKIIDASPYGKRIEFYTNGATAVLDQLIADGLTGTFDFAFIDADKQNYIEYYERCMKLLRSGGIISVDNALYNGKVADPSATGSAPLTIRALNALVKDDVRCDNCLLSTGDGLHLIFKR